MRLLRNVSSVMDISVAFEPNGLTGHKMRTHFMCEHGEYIYNHEAYACEVREMEFEVNFRIMLTISDDWLNWKSSERINGGNMTRNSTDHHISIVF